MTNERIFSYPVTNKHVKFNSGLKLFDSSLIQDLANCNVLSSDIYGKAIEKI